MAAAAAPLWEKRGTPLSKLDYFFGLPASFSPDCLGFLSIRLRSIPSARCEMFGPAATAPCIIGIRGKCVLYRARGLFDWLFCSWLNGWIAVAFLPSFCPDPSRNCTRLLLEKLKGQKLRGTNLPGEHACSSLAALWTLWPSGMVGQTLKFVFPVSGSAIRTERFSTLPPFPSNLPSSP